MFDQAVFDQTEQLEGARPELADAFREVWRSIASPGNSWSGEERVAIAAVARSAWEGAAIPETSLPAPAVAASEVLGGRPGTVRAPLVDGWYQDGLAMDAYVELVGVVSRVTAVDTFHRAIGLALEALPDPVPGAPRRDDPPAGARRGGRSFAPTVGPTTIPSVLSYVPEENEGWMSLADAMYLTFREMESPDTFKDLHRTQIELVAARTSLLNECFF